MFAPNHHLLIAGGKKGGIFAYDLRKNQLLQSFAAHEMNTKSLAVDRQQNFLGKHRTDHKSPAPTTAPSVSGPSRTSR